MSHPIPPDAQRLADRLRMLADEVESAARYGVPIPYMFNASGHTHGDASFSATPEEFDAWAEYTEADVEDYDHNDSRWSKATADVNGLPLSFSTKRGAVVAAS